MVTGVEIVGLVLGAFPLAIEVINAYGSGVEKVRHMKKYKQVLDQFIRDLEVEKCIYDNTVLALLEGLSTDPNSADWDNEDFRSQVRVRLGPVGRTLDNWLYVAQQLNETLDTVYERFKVGQEKKVLPPYMYPIHRTLY